MNSIWNKNLQLFTQRFGSLAKLFQTEIDLVTSASSEEIEKIFSFWKVSDAKNGTPTAVTTSNVDSTSNLRLHSSYNPQREAEGIVTQAPFLEKEQIVFLGCGLGYHLIACAKKINENKLQKKLVLIEQDVMHFFAALYYLDWSEVFKTEQLVIAAGCPVDSILPLLESSEHINTGSSGVSDAYFFTVPAFTAHNQSYFDAVKTLIERNKTKNDINAATYNKFSKLWIRNSKKNTKHIEHCRTILQYAAQTEEMFKNQNKPFVLVAAGPSLEKLLPYLHAIKEKVHFVCVETALRALLQHDINPDFIVLTDPQYYAYAHIAALKAPESTLICPISVYPAVFRFQCKEILLCSDIFPISQFYENKLGAFGDLGAGGSVASSAWNLCYLLGAKNIYVAGLDLSYPSKETHIRGSKAEQTFHTLSNRLTTAEKISINSMYSAIPEYGIDYDGNKVLTDSRMKMFAWWFESRIAACNSHEKNVNVYSLSKESMKIPGIEYRQEIDFNLQNQSSMQRPVPLNKADLSLATPACIGDIQHAYHTAISQLINLINLAVEKCIINGPQLQQELNSIQNQIAANPLKEILVLANPSSTYLEEHKSTPPQLAIYEKLQKEVIKFL